MMYQQSPELRVPNVLRMTDLLGCLARHIDGSGIPVSSTVLLDVVI